MSEITDRLSNLSPEEQRALLAQLLQEEAPKPQMTPLSFSQERIWFLEQLAPGSTANIVHFVRLAGRFDMASLRQTLNEKESLINAPRELSMEWQKTKKALDIPTPILMQ